MFRFIRKLILLAIILAFFVICIITGGGYLEYKRAVDNISIEQKVNEIHAVEHYTTLEDIATYMKDGVVAIEDRRFYQHDGVDYYALMRSLVVNITNQGHQGGSTLSQQLAKNMYFMEDNSGFKKVAEAFVAKDLEHMYTKDEILEMYLNIIYYGDGHYGIYEASMGYYGVLPKDLNITQASVLSGMAQAPSIYMLSNRDSITKDRQKQVLNAMLDLQMITKRDYDEAMKANIFEGVK